MRKATVIFWSRDDAVKAAATVEVAETVSDRVKGLSNRKEVPEGTGMLFRPASTFWMRDTLVPLDLIYVLNNRIIKQLNMPVPETGKPLKSYGLPEGASDYAIEFPEGWLKKRNVKEGDKVTILEEKK